MYSMADAARDDSFANSASFGVRTCLPTTASEPDEQRVDAAAFSSSKQLEASEGERDGVVERWWLSGVVQCKLTSRAARGRRGVESWRSIQAKLLSQPCEA